MPTSTLFTPISIGRMELKNRVVMPAMVTQYASLDGEVNERIIDYYVARAAGGTGLIIVEAAYVTPEGKRDPNQIAVDRDDRIEGLRRLASAIQAAGAKAALQLQHSGRSTSSSIIGQQPVAPSALITRGPRNAPRELTVEEIHNLVEAYGESARRAKEAGFDAVEVHGAHGHLLQQFLSPRSNKRTDEYGGSFDGRFRFLLEIMQRVREKVGPDYPVIYRLNGDEVVEDGSTHEEAKEASRRLVAAGADAINVSVGPSDAPIPTTSPPMEVKQGWITHLAEGVRKVVDVPVIAVGRITDARVAERVLQDGQADMIAIGRGLIADADWTNKARERAFDEVRRCIGCKEGCGERIRLSQGLGCLLNPGVGKEKEYVIRSAARKKRVVVVGGGPAGIEAARVAALRGHDVTLYEKENYLGGQLVLAARIPGRGEFGNFIRRGARDLREAGVRVELGFKANATFVEDLAPDALVIATGVRLQVPDFVRQGAPEAVSAYDVVAGKAEVGKRVLILGGGLVGFETAAWLAERQRDVRLVEVLAGAHDRPHLEQTHALLLLDRLKERGVAVYSCAQVNSVRDGVVALNYEEAEDLLKRYAFRRVLREKGFREFDQPTDTLDGYDTLVVALGAAPDQTLANELRRSIPLVHIIGDANKPRKALEAVEQGAEVGRSI